MSYAVIIPAQEKNKYHKKGDLAPFGDTTLLEWKISQCKEFVKASDIYINSESKFIENIVKKEEVNFIKRSPELSYISIILETLKSINTEDVIWINSTSPFMSSKIYSDMYKMYKDKKLDSLVAVEKIKEYVFFKNQKLNFSNEFISRDNIEPIYIMTNGCYIIKREKAIQFKNLLLPDNAFYEVDSFISTEIKDINDYLIAKDMISIYFKKEFNV